MTFNFQYKLMFLTMFNYFLAKMYLERQLCFLQNIWFVQQKHLLGWTWTETWDQREKINIYPNHMSHWPLLTFALDFRLWPYSTSSFPWTAHTFWARGSVWLLGKPYQVQWGKKGSGMMNPLRQEILKGSEWMKAYKKDVVGIFLLKSKRFLPLITGDLPW